MAEPTNMKRSERALPLSFLQDEISRQIEPLLTDQPFALVDFPDHSNVGDSAIWLGETCFFSKHGLTPAYCSSLRSHSSADMKAAIGKGPIYLHGGGNFGTIWKAHQDFRIDLLKSFPHQPIVQLPQSIHFQSLEMIDETAKAIEQHGNFTLLVRDKPSLDFAQRHFQCETLLCPDMAFFMGSLERRSPTYDIFYLLRTDLEGAIQGEVQHGKQSFKVDDWLEESRLSIKMTSALSRLVNLAGNAQTARFDRYDRLARARLSRGIDMLSSGRVVVTDRLHGHIMSTLLGIPNVALDNNYGKLQNFIQAWTSEIEFLRTASTLEQAGQLAERLIR